MRIAALSGLFICASAAFMVQTATAARIFGVAPQGAVQNLVSWNSASPSSLLSSLPITGLPANEIIRAIDFEEAYFPGNQRIFALGTGNNQYANIYSIDPFTAVATQLPPSIANPDIVRGVDYGFHSSPVSLWSVTDNGGVLSGHNRTLNSGAAQASLAYGAGDVSAGFVPHLVHFEDRSFISDLAIDTARDTLVRITGSSNPRIVQTIAPLNADFDDEGGLDLDVLGGVLYASLQPAGQTQSNFYSLNHTTGALTLIGPIGGGAVIRAMSVEPIATAVPEPSAALMLVLGGVAHYAARRWHRRT
jgi:hypothetical protein